MHSTIELPFSDEKIRCSGTLSSAPSGPPGDSALTDIALARDPSLAAAWANRGILAYETGDLDGAVHDLTRAPGFGGGTLANVPILNTGEAIALRAAGRAQEALADLTRALELDPRDDDVRHALTAS